MNNYREPAILTNVTLARAKASSPTAPKDAVKTGQEKCLEERWEDLPLFLTVKDIQRLLHISKNTAYSIIRSGELRAKTVGRQYRVPRAELLRYTGK